NRLPQCKGTLRRRHRLAPERYSSLTSAPLITAYSLSLMNSTVKARGSNHWPRCAYAQRAGLNKYVPSIKDEIKDVERLR
ncbi:hypothetical protein N8654_04890, partial [Synechococcus sp. AH-601-B19]|nr:hypothetical protein [Synechococcus sp. AH-601-B19]